MNSYLGTLDKIQSISSNKAFLLQVGFSQCLSQQQKANLNVKQWFSNFSVVVYFHCNLVQKHKILAILVLMDIQPVGVCCFAVKENAVSIFAHLHGSGNTGSPMFMISFDMSHDLKPLHQLPSPLKLCNHSLLCYIIHICCLILGVCLTGRSLIVFRCQFVSLFSDYWTNLLKNLFNLCFHFCDIDRFCNL